MASGGALGTINRGCIYCFLYQRTPQGRGVFLFLASVLVPESLANFSENSKFLQTAPSHCLTASLTEYGAIKLLPLMGTKGQPLIIHSECQTMLVGCYLGWGRPIE